MTRVAAVGDIHVGRDTVGQVAAGFRHLAERADALLQESGARVPFAAP